MSKLDEKSCVACWYMDENLGLWPEFDKKKGYEYFDDTDLFNQVSDFIKASVGTKYKTVKDAYLAYKNGTLKFKKPKVSEKSVEKPSSEDSIEDDGDSKK